MKKTEYEKHLQPLQIELAHLQQWVVKSKLKVAVVFEGRDASGKGGVIKAITQRLNPRIVRIAALPKPTEKEQSQWYFQRYVEHLPSAGEMVLFDRSWYNRAGVERVLGFCTNNEYREFLRSCPLFEEMLINAGIILIKYWFSVSDAEQEKRFNQRITNPLKRWKFSETDIYSRSHWLAYSKAKDDMFLHTDTEKSPWYLVDSDDKKAARLNCISHLLAKIPYEKQQLSEITLPEIDKSGYQRPPKHHFNWVDKQFE